MTIKQPKVTQKTTSERNTSKSPRRQRNVEHVILSNITLLYHYSPVYFWLLIFFIFYLYLGWQESNGREREDRGESGMTSGHNWTQVSFVTVSGLETTDGAGAIFSYSNHKHIEILLLPQQPPLLLMLLRWCYCHYLPSSLPRLPLTATTTTTTSEMKMMTMNSAERDGAGVGLELMGMEMTEFLSFLFSTVGDCCRNKPRRQDNLGQGRTWPRMARTAVWHDVVSRSFKCLSGAVSFN